MTFRELLADRTLGPLVVALTGAAAKALTADEGVHDAMMNFVVAARADLGVKDR